MEIFGMAGAATIGLLEVIKKMVLSEDKESRLYKIGMRFVPLTGIALGVLCASIYAGGYSNQILGLGIIIGLSAQGLYSGGKTTAGK